VEVAVRTLFLSLWTATRVVARTIVWLVDQVCQVYLRNTDPRHAVTSYVLLNAAATIIAWWKASDWNEFYTITGYWATATGLLVALLELYRTRTVAGEVRTALDREIRRQRDAHYRFCLELTQASLNETAVQVQSHMWKVAVARLRDLRNHLSRVNSVSPAADDFWNLSANSLHPWIVRFDAGKDRQRLPYNALEWEQLLHAIGVRLHGELAVFQPGAEGGHDPE